MKKAILLTILPIIAQIESNNNCDAIGDDGDAIGHLQIHECVVQDVNQLLGYNAYCHEEMDDRSKAEEVFYIYLDRGINLYKSKHNKLPLELEIVRMWNGGIYTGHNSIKTIPYSKKYIHAKRLHE